MKIYTHPTIYLPAGAIVVKFYDDSLTGAETTPDIIITNGIGDVEDGFDLSLGDLTIGTCDFKLRNKNNYVLGTLFNTRALRIAVLVDGECYFYGDIDFSTIAPDNELDPSADNHYSNINFTAIGALSLAQYISMFELHDYIFSNLGSIPSDIFYFYLDVILQGLCLLLGLDDTINYECQRLYSHLANDYKLKDLIFGINWLNNDGTAWANAYPVELNNSFNFLGMLARDFFFFPAVIFDGTYFQLKVIEKDCGSVITLPPVKKRAPAAKYLMHSITSSLKNMPEVPNGSDIGLAYSYTSGEHYGDDLTLDFYHTNISKKFYTNVINEPHATVSVGDTLSVSTPISINVDNTALLGSIPSSGTLYMMESGHSLQFTYSGKTSTSFTGCIYLGGSYTFSAGAQISVDGTGNAHTLSTSPINIKVSDTSLFNYAGTLTIINGLNSQQFTYTNKTANAFTGCTIDSGTFDFVLGSAISVDGKNYITNLLFNVGDIDILVDKVTNPDASDYASFNNAVTTAYKKYYYDKNRWVDYTVYGLKADSYLQNILPGKQFTDAGKTYLIHTVKRSVGNNDTLLTCLIIS